MRREIWFRKRRFKEAVRKILATRGLKIGLKQSKPKGWINFRMCEGLKVGLKQHLRCELPPVQ